MKKLMALALISLSVFISCDVEEEFEKNEEALANAPSQFNSFEDTKIPIGFEYKTSKEVTVNLTVPVFLKNAIFGLDRITRSRDTVNILRGSFNQEGNFTQKVTLGQSTEKLILDSEL